ncbi:hypothetical protein LFL96_33580 [Paraburkholderia sp. D15]|uniref:hypothetical protein n=1 Tax=Paraburkholderia sp. D15 TaxID=2880218 RepID=UPI0024794B27|nr:hypothetical protein [Paraburkholderia sp. D15]WGS53104.1 hypothetical protein LFL96_33580 [Paraburkholderia sp. D15]WKF61455.1 hypothetical protein HUO10_005986 [Paraburkholderia busanensis]
MSVALLSGMLPPATARADGPVSAYGKGAMDASLDPGEERMTADEENNARLKDISDAYHNGYNARAKEDAETYASLREQLKRPSKVAPNQVMPPLPEGVPGDEEAQVNPVQKPHVVQRALLAQQPPQPVPQVQQPQYRQAYQQPLQPQQPQYVPQPPQAVAYQQAPEYAEAPPAYAQAQEMYSPAGYAEEEAYAPAPAPRLAQPVQYMPVYAQPTYVPQPPPQALAQPVIMVARPAAYPGYRRAYWARPYRRPAPVHYGYAVQAGDYRDWQ